MRHRKIIILTLILSPILSVSGKMDGSALEANLPVIVKEKEVKQLMQKLRSHNGDASWPQRKKIIAQLIQAHKISPNAIILDFLDEKPLKDAVLHDDIFFASFLLKHGADPNIINLISGKEILETAKSRPMAQLLFAHGAQLTENLKKTILGSVIWHDRDPSLIPLYIQHGATIHGDMPLLIDVILHLDAQNLIKSKKYLQESKKYLQESLLAGARIEEKVTRPGSSWVGWNAAMILRKKINDATATLTRSLDPEFIEPYPGYIDNRRKDIDNLQDIRSIMKQAYAEGECAIKKQAIGVDLVPELANMCIKSYEELEKLP